MTHNFIPSFDVLELSSGFLSIPTEDWASLVEFTAAHGLKPKPEVGIQWGAGGDASVEELESAGTRDPKWLIDRANTFLQAGAYVRPAVYDHTAPTLTRTCV